MYPFLFYQAHAGVTHQSPAEEITHSIELFLPLLAISIICGALVVGTAYLLSKVFTSVD
jgi:hypothetical protein